MSSNDGKFTKGKSGNPGGRPYKSSTFQHLYGFYVQYTKDELLDMLKNGKFGSPLPAKDAVVIRRILRAFKMERSLMALEDRLDGKPIQTISHESDAPVKAEIVFSDIPADKEDEADEKSQD